MQFVSLCSVLYTRLSKVPEHSNQPIAMELNQVQQNQVHYMGFPEILRGGGKELSQTIGYGTPVLCLTTLFNMACSFSDV